MIEQGQLNASQVAHHLLELSRELDTITKTLNAADIEAAELAEDAKLAESKAFVTAEGSMDMRKHRAIIETHEIRLKARVAEAMVRGHQRTVRTLQSRIDVGRSHGAALRSELSLIGSGVHT